MDEQRRKLLHDAEALLWQVPEQHQRLLLRALVAVLQAGLGEELGERLREHLPWTDH